MCKKWLVLLCAVVMMCGCAASRSDVAGPALLPPEEEPVVESVLQPCAEVIGSFEDEEQAVPPEIEQLVLDYMDLYYRSVANLNLCPFSELKALFTADGYEQALGNHTVWNYLIETRKMQPTDLSMTSCSYTVACRSLSEQGDGSLRLMVEEQSVQNFSAHPDVDSEVFDVYHSFTLVMLADGSWRLGSHMQMDSLYFSLFGNHDESQLSKAFAEPAFERQDAEPFLQHRLQSLLQSAKQHYSQRGYGSCELLETDHPYDREAAVAYAHLYADERNPEWDDYGRFGGNCQNFASQCLLAGGIPMDIKGNAIWKWYGTTPNEQRTTYGRSAAWSSVESFREYVVNNKGGPGIVAVLDAPYYSGEKGDLLQMGTDNDNWKHVVIITDLVKDSQGRTVDYLINSNTADLRNYPAGAYTYTNLSPVHIYGWNE